MYNDDNELALREHVRNLLAEYIYTHLATDYVQYSDASVSEILSRILRPIPFHGSGEIALPIDPFESLKTKLKFDSLTPYDEVWKPSPEAVQLLKGTYLTLRTRPKTETIWAEEDDFDFENMPHRPITPVLSRSSRTKTPLIAKHSRDDTKTRCLASDLSARGIRPITDEQLPKEKPMKLEDHLDLRLTIDASTHANVVDLQKQIHLLARHAPRPLPLYAIEFLRTRSPDYQERFMPISPPVFAREYRSYPSRKENEISITGPMKLGPLEVPTLDLDITTESMKVIEGWTTLPSRTSTPSLSSGTSEVDELNEDSGFWRPSSPSRPLAVEPLESVKMDIPIFPRSERPGARKAELMNEKQGQSLSSFISGHIPLDSSVRILTSPKSDDIQPRLDAFPAASMSAVSLSMLGHPPSDSGTLTMAADDSADVTLERDIRRIIKVHSLGEDLKSYRDIIMDESLDGEGTMFMDVPKLPAPNEYLRNQGSGDTKSVVISGETSNMPTFTLPTTFKKATGLKSLNLELSWRPFSFGSKIPTHTELIGADSLFDDANKQEGEIPLRESVQKYLGGLVFPVEPDELNDPNTNVNTDARILNDVRIDDDFEILKVKYDLDRDFDEDDFLLCRSDRYGPGIQVTYKPAKELSADDSRSLTDLQPDESSDFPSAVTPEFGEQVPLTQHADAAYAYTLPLADAIVNEIPTADYDYAYEGHHEHDLEAFHDRKKCRLTVNELDALCAMENMSQSAMATINPKDLVLPHSDDTSDSRDRIQAQAAITLTNTHQIILASSQSQSLSLSLIEDNASLDGIPANADGGAFDYISDDPISPYDQNEIAPTFDMLTPCDLYQPDSRAVVPDQLDLHPKERDCSVSLDASAFPQMSHSLLAIKFPIPTRTVSQRADGDFEPTENRRPYHPSLSKPLSVRDKLSEFLMLRGKTTHDTTPALLELTARGREGRASPHLANLDEGPTHSYRFAPSDLLTVTRALSLPKPWQIPSRPHTYLISVDCVQQRALVHALESPLCAVRLVERDIISPLVSLSSDIPQSHSGEISIIVGPDSGVIFFPLSALPSEKANNALLDSVSSHSWRFSHILIVSVAFPRSHMLRITDPVRGSENALGMYSPAVLKEARRIRRNIAVREGTGQKRPSCAIELAFADDVEQAAMFIRAFGDLSLQDTRVDFTPYIGEEEQEGEHDLAELEGMNAFCAVIILQCCTLEEFLEMSPEQRTEGLTDLIGKERIEHVNAILDKRLQEMEADSFYSSELIQ